MLATSRHPKKLGENRDCNLILHSFGEYLRIHAY